jgi:hypothetical protein
MDHLGLNVRRANLASAFGEFRGTPVGTQSCAKKEENEKEEEEEEDEEKESVARRMEPS